MARIAVQPDNQELMSGRLQSFSTAWREQLAGAGHQARVVDAYHP
jgi:hypothetical protein